jgi:MFS family permease
MIFQNLASMLFAYPAGWLSDRIDRRWLLAFGFMLTIASNLFLAQGGGMFWGLIGATLWGAQIGVVQSLIMAKITDHTSQNLRATAFGIYYVLIAFAVLIGNKLMGHFYETMGPAWGFYVSAAVAGLAILTLPLVKSPQVLKHH